MIGMWVLVKDQFINATPATLREYMAWREIFSHRGARSGQYIDVGKLSYNKNI